MRIPLSCVALEVRQSLLVLLVLLSAAACVASKNGNGLYSRIDASVDDGCTRKRSVMIYQLDESLRKSVTPFPIRVNSGTHKVGVSCWWVFSKELNKCADVRSDASAPVPPYKIVLEPATDYIFSCTERQKPSANRAVVQQEATGDDSEDSEDTDKPEKPQIDTAAEAEIKIKYDIRMKTAHHGSSKKKGQRS